MGDFVTRPDYDMPAICYANNFQEFNELINVLSDNGLIEYGGDYFKIKYDGILRAEQLKKEISKSNSAFVAMWFDPSMDEVYAKAIKPAIQAKECGKFLAFKVNDHEHNNDITDEIIAGIKACRFMVADLSGSRGGVYFEAGYAKGLGKPVIYTCKKCWFYGEKDADGRIIKEKVHFDLNHQNIIVWDDIEDLKEKIINRIKATII